MGKGDGTSVDPMECQTRPQPVAG